MTSAPLMADCPLCGPNASRVWTREAGWTVVRCLACGLLQTWPRPDPAATEAFYASGAYYESRSMGKQARGSWATRAGAILGALAQKPVRILDLGAGQGHLVDSFRALGLVAEGVEPSRAGRDAAREHYSIDLWERIPVSGQLAFDLITLIHSLEHSRHPVHTLEELYPLLQPGGGVFIEVPHAESVEMWSRRRRREILDLPAHLYHFVPRTLSQVVERAGFRVTRVCLSNPSFVESALAVRARMRGPRRADIPAPDEVSTDAAVGVRRAASGSRNWWTEGLLPWIRRTLPGWKFQLLATKPP